MTDSAISSAGARLRAPRRRARRTVLSAILALCLSSLLGCVSLEDMLDEEDHLEIYGGTRRSYEQMEDPAQPWWGILIRIIDLPLTVALDTLFLPLTIPFDLSR